VDALEDLRDIDLLLVDGPASALPPALHVLGRRLAPGAAVVVDDPPAGGDRTAPRQGAGALTPERRLLGRYTALTYTSPMAHSARETPRDLGVVVGNAGLIRHKATTTPRSRGRGRAGRPAAGDGGGRPQRVLGGGPETYWNRSPG
jgi:hypothetical protein